MKENGIMDMIGGEKRGSNVLLYALLFILLLLAALGGVYYCLFYMQESNHSSMGSLKSAQTSITVTDSVSSQEIKRLKNELEQRQQQIDRLIETRMATDMSAKLSYTIHPKEKIITECHTMDVGKWAIPENCAISVAANVHKELEEDKRVVVFEVQGIVDSTPYKGLSPELKQEGLASFRAREAIRAIALKLPDAVAFEGPSSQEKSRRGYRIKAYYVE
ncbi:MAG: hypothetical protein ACTTH5_01805 [Wolinella sp.]